MDCDGIDTSLYKNDWKNLPGGIGCEVVNVTIHPWSLDLENDSITERVEGDQIPGRKAAIQSITIIPVLDK